MLIISTKALVDGSRGAPATAYDAGGNSVMETAASTTLAATSTVEAADCSQQRQSQTHPMPVQSAAWRLARRHDEDVG